eukprot:Nk52_evm46s236 gene=Nk52_evmTU46s236
MGFWSRSTNDAEHEESKLSPEEERLIEMAIAKDKERISPLDLGERFAYGGLVACYCPLDGPEGVDSKWSRGFCERLWKHLELSEGHQMALTVFVTGEFERNAEPFEEDLLKEDKDPHRWIIWQDLLEMSIINGVYDARARVIAWKVTGLFSVPWTCVEEFESVIAENLMLAAEETEEEKSEREAKEKKRKRNKWLKVTAAALGGGAIVGLTGGLAAPILAAGAGAVVGASSGAFLASAGGIALVTTLFGAAGAGIGGYKMQKRVGDLEEFEFKAITREQRMHAIICITGWIETPEYDYAIPWVHLKDVGEQYSLRWDSEKLAEVNEALKNLIKNGALSFAAQETLKHTLLSGIMMGLAWPLALLQVSNIIDNPWSITANRAEDAGIALANVLRQHVQGNRPVTLMGYCFGASVIYYCLLDLGRSSNVDELKGIVQDVYLFGAPIPSREEDWKIVKSVVAGNLYNGYSKTDWLLKFVYRATAAETKVAGLAPLDYDFIMNVDLTDIVSKSSEYTERMPYILERFDLLAEDVELEPLVQTPAEEGGEEGDVVVTVDAAEVNKETKDEDPKVNRQSTINELLAVYGDESDAGSANTSRPLSAIEDDSFDVNSGPSAGDIGQLLMEYSRRLSDDVVEGGDSHVYKNSAQSKYAYKGELTDDDIAMIMAGPSPKLNLEDVKKDMAAGESKGEKKTEPSKGAIETPSKKKKSKRKKRPVNLADQARMMKIEKEYASRPKVNCMKKNDSSVETEV